jgi:F-type H+-transporting ATPase subunit b
MEGAKSVPLLRLMDLILPQFGLFFWSALIFGIFFFLLRKYAWKPILRALQEREKKIADALAAAQKAQADIEALRREQEQARVAAAQEQQRILAEAQKMRDEILENARKEAQRQAQAIIALAYQEIDRQRDRILTEMRTQAAKLALDIAQKILEDHFQDRAKAEAFALKMANELRIN